MERLFADLKENSYDIVFTNDFNELANRIKKKYNKILIVTDSNVAPLYADEVKNKLKKTKAEVCTHIIPAGEENKSMNEILNICSSCIKYGLGRTDLIAALGGGVVGDMAGFAAAIYMRGIDFIQLPTTLLSQSDSSVGGKTGVDFETGKNILGAFHQPKLVYINTDTLKTLPDEQIASGMGEVIKHGIIRDRQFFEYIRDNKDKILSLDADTMISLSLKNCSIKADIVTKDEKENGLRMILNFGHTIGHAIESALDFRLTHGECVGLGMEAAGHIAKNRGIFTELDEIENILRAYKIKTRIKLPDYEIILKLMQKDKKKTAQGLRFILPVGIGDVIEVSDVTEKEIISALNYINGSEKCI